MKMRVEVTTEDIAKGSKNSLIACPIALAIGRVDELKDLLVGTTTIFGNRRNVFMPPEAVAFIAAFDNGEPVSPITFDID